MNNIINNEKQIDRQIFNLIYHSFYNQSINEDSGHPLFKYGDSKETFDWLDRIYNVIDVINDKLKTTKIKARYKIKINDKDKTSYVYDEYLPISIALNKLGFKDVIDSRHSNFKIIVRNVVDGANELSDYLKLRNISSGTYKNSIYREVIKSKFNNNAKDSIIMDCICYAIDGKIIPISFLRVFLHEYLHFYEHYNRFIDKTFYSQNKMLRHINAAQRTVNRFVFSEEEANALKYVVYHLYTGEDNAKIGELFSDLISFNIKDLSEFNANKKDFLSFFIYEELKKSIQIIKGTDVKELANFIRANPMLFQIKNYKMGVDKTDNFSDEYLVKKFIKSIEIKTTKFYEKLMKFVGRYIYMQQEHENEIVTSVNQY